VGVRDPLAADAEVVPPVRRRLVLVDGRTFTDKRRIRPDDKPYAGMVHDDRRHFSYFTVTVEHAEIERLPGGSAGETACSTTVHVLPDCNHGGQVIDTRRRLDRWFSKGVRHVATKRARSATWISSRRHGR
jgi:hypothetical protein